jgi:hypothetical protein
LWGALGFAPGVDEYVTGAAFGGIGLGAQFKAAAAVVVLLVDEVTQTEFARCLGGGDLGA